MTELWLIRHGQTDWNAEGRWQGQAALAPSLNAAGRAQALALAAQLDGQPFAALYSSDLLRARETAEILAVRTGKPVRFDARLREISQGEWEGQLGHELAGRYPEQIAARRQDPVHARAPGGETVAEVAGRVWAAADDIARRHAPGPVLIVSHGLALATLRCRVQGVPLARAGELIPDNAHPLVILWPPGHIISPSTP